MSDGEPCTHTQDSHLPWAGPRNVPGWASLGWRRGRGQRRTRCPVHLHLRGGQRSEVRGVEVRIGPPLPPTPRPRLALLETDLVRGHAKLLGCLLPSLGLSAPAHPVPPVRVLPCPGGMSTQGGASSCPPTNTQCTQSLPPPQMCQSPALAWFSPPLGARRGR